MNNCQRCDSQKVSWTEDLTDLIGGAKAHLCYSCINEFHKLVVATPEWEALRVINVGRSLLELKAIAGRCEITFEDLDSMSKLKEKLFLSFFELSIEFIKLKEPSQTSN